MSKNIHLQSIILLTVIIGVSPALLPPLVNAIPIEQIPKLNQQAGL